MLRVRFEARVRSKRCNRTLSGLLGPMVSKSVRQLIDGRPAAMPCAKKAPIPPLRPEFAAYVSFSSGLVTGRRLAGKATLPVSDTLRGHVSVSSMLHTSQFEQIHEYQGRKISICMQKRGFGTAITNPRQSSCTNDRWRKHTSVNETRCCAIVKQAT
jgi:hypothetical protein